LKSSIYCPSELATAAAVGKNHKLIGSEARGLRRRRRRRRWRRRRRRRRKTYISHGIGRH
jgi:hypothetical protein